MHICGNRVDELTMCGLLYLRRGIIDLVSDCSRTSVVTRKDRRFTCIESQWNPMYEQGTIDYSPSFNVRNSKVEMHLGPRLLFGWYWKYSAHDLLVSYKPPSTYSLSIARTTCIASLSDRCSNITDRAGITPGTDDIHSNVVSGVLLNIRTWREQSWYKSTFIKPFQ